MNKWINPPPRENTTSDLSDQFSTAIGKGISFDTIKEQVGKKSISTKSKSDRVSAKSWGGTY
jgi:hypothetical protein